MEVQDLGCPTLELYYSKLVTMVTLTPWLSDYRYFLLLCFFLSFYAFLLIYNVFYNNNIINNVSKIDCKMSPDIVASSITRLFRAKKSDMPYSSLNIQVTHFKHTGGQIELISNKNKNIFTIKYIPCIISFYITPQNLSFLSFPIYVSPTGNNVKLLLCQCAYFAEKYDCFV